MDEKVSKKLLNLDRNVLTQIIHSISGHNNLRYFSNETVRSAKALMNVVHARDVE